MKDYYKIGNCRLYNANNIDVLEDIESESIDAIITDPPYLYTDAKFDKNGFNELETFNHFYRVQKQNTLLGIWGYGKSYFRWNYILDEIGYNFKQEVIWNKRKAGAFQLSFHRIHENFAIHQKGSKALNLVKIDYIDYLYDNDYINNVVELLRGLYNAINSKDKEKILKYIDDGIKIYDTKKKHKHKITSEVKYSTNQNLNYFSTLKEGTTMKSIITKAINNFNYTHPTQKNVSVLEKLILLTTSENDLILDAFMGSGALAIACINTNRRFIGIELDKKYFDIAIKNITDVYNEKKTLFDCVVNE